MCFDGTVVFITGGGIGFGRALARALAGEGASIVIADIDTEAGVSPRFRDIREPLLSPSVF